MDPSTQALAAALIKLTGVQRSAAYGTASALGSGKAEAQRRGVRSSGEFRNRQQEMEELALSLYEVDQETEAVTSSGRCCAPCGELSNEQVSAQYVDAIIAKAQLSTAHIAAPGPGEVKAAEPESKPLRRGRQPPPGSSQYLVTLDDQAEAQQRGARLGREPPRWQEECRAGAGKPITFAEAQRRLLAQAKAQRRGVRLGGELRSRQQEMDALTSGLKKDTPLAWLMAPMTTPKAAKSESKPVHFGFEPATPETSCPSPPLPETGPWSPSGSASWSPSERVCAPSPTSSHYLVAPGDQIETPCPWSPSGSASSRCSGPCSEKGCAPSHYLITPDAQVEAEQRGIGHSGEHGSLRQEMEALTTGLEELQQSLRSKSGLQARIPDMARGYAACAIRSAAPMKPPQAACTFVIAGDSEEEYQNEYFGDSQGRWSDASVAEDDHIKDISQDANTVQHEGDLGIDVKLFDAMQAAWRSSCGQELSEGRRSSAELDTFLWPSSELQTRQEFRDAGRIRLSEQPRRVGGA